MLLCPNQIATTSSPPNSTGNSGSTFAVLPNARRHNRVHRQSSQPRTLLHQTGVQALRPRWPLTALTQRNTEFGDSKTWLVCIDVKNIILSWARAALEARYTVANEGVIYGCSQIIRTPRPTKRLLRSWQRDAYHEAERWRSHPVYYEFYVGLGDLHGNAADLLPWPP